MKTTAYILGSMIAYLVLCIATFLMLQMAIDYSSFKTDIHFLQFKQDYIGIPLWRAAFYTHVFSSVLALDRKLARVKYGFIIMHILIASQQECFHLYQKTHKSGQLVPQGTQQVSRQICTMQ